MVRNTCFQTFVLLCFDIFAVQPDFFARSIAMALYTLIIDFFLQYLCMEQVLAANLYQFLQLVSKFVSQAGSGEGVGIFFKQNSRVESAKELKRSTAGASILSIVISKRSQWQQFCPMVLLPINKCFELRLYCTIISLGLAICLWVKSCR